MGPAVSLAVHSAKRTLGIRRSAPTKILPFLLIVLAFFPAIFIVGAIAFLPQARILVPGPQQYYGLITTIIFLFVALVSPELLCPDRRTGMLGLYLTSPLTPLTYLASKVVALVSILCVVTLAPPLLLLLALTLQGAGPHSATALLTELGRIALSGASVAALFAMVALAVSSLTDRRAFASAGVVLLVLVPSVVGGILVGAFKYPRWVRLTSLTLLPFELVQRIFGRTGVVPAVATWTVVAMYAGILVAAALVLLVRYDAIPRPRRGQP